MKEKMVNDKKTFGRYCCNSNTPSGFIGIEEGLRMIRGIAGLILSNLNLDDEDARAGAEAIWEIVCRIETNPGTFPAYRPLEEK